MVINLHFSTLRAATSMVFFILVSTVLPPYEVIYVGFEFELICKLL